MDCDLRRDYTPAGQHYGGLQGVPATDVTFVPAGSADGHTHAHSRVLAAYASLPTSLEGKCQPLQTKDTGLRDHADNGIFYIQGQAKR